MSQRRLNEFALTYKNFMDSIKTEDVIEAAKQERIRITRMGKRSNKPKNDGATVRAKAQQFLLTANGASEIFRPETSTAKGQLKKSVASGKLNSIEALMIAAEREEKERIRIAKALRMEALPAEVIDIVRPSPAPKRRRANSPQLITVSGPLTENQPKAQTAGTRATWMETYMEAVKTVKSRTRRGCSSHDGESEAQVV